MSGRTASARISYRSGSVVASPSQDQPESAESNYRRDGVSFARFLLLLSAACSRDGALIHCIIWSWNSGRNQDRRWLHRAPTCVHSVVCPFACFPHQLYGILGTRFDRTFERVWIPDVKISIYHRANRQFQENIPNGSTVELKFGDSRFPIFAKSEPDVEYRQHTGDGKVCRSESQVLPGTYPTSRSTIIRNSERRGWCITLTSFRLRKLSPRD